MTKSRELDILKKAILYECSNMLEKSNKDVRPNTSTLDEVTSFYNQLRDKFVFSEHGINYNMSLGFDELERHLEEVTKWLGDNNIQFFKNNSVLYFSSEEDVMAYKLRWGE